MDRDRQISDGRFRFLLAICVIKRLDLLPLDRDRTAEMRSAPKHLSRYNAFKNARGFDHRRWTAGARDRRA